MIECCAIGTWELKVNGKPPPPALKERKNFALLAYLARCPKRTRTRDQLIGVLWPDKPEHDARRSLNVALSAVRTKLKLGDHALTTDGARMVLAPGTVAVDVERLDYLAQIGDLKGATELLEGRGSCEFLAGLYLADAPEFEDWLLAERTALRRRAVDVLTRRSVELLDLGRARDSAVVSEQALKVDDLYEPAVRSAMRARAQCADRTGALALYEQFKARLADRLGAVPDAETTALSERLKRGWVTVDQKQSGAAGSSEPARRAPLEDRVEALHQLVKAWRVCLGKPCRSVVIVEGDPGMGKTRLVEDLAVRARLDGAAVIGSRAVEADLTSPWSGVVTLCRHGLLEAPGAAGASPDALAVLRSENPEPGRVGPALDQVVQAICEEQALMLVLDDAQWLDRESLLAVLATLRISRPAPLAIVVTTTRQSPPRPELEEMRARLGREVAGAAVRLAPLTLEAIRHITTWALPLGKGAAEDKQRDRIARRVAADSAGIPLLVVTLLDAICLGLELRDQEHGWPRPGQTLDHTFPGDLPDNVTGAMRVMFGRATPVGQKVLTALAVLGPRVPVATLCRATELPHEGVIAALDALEWKQWVVADPLGYGFVARVFRDVVDRDMVIEGQRQRIRTLAAS